MKEKFLIEHPEYKYTPVIRILLSKEEKQKRRRARMAKWREKNRLKIRKQFNEWYKNK